MNLGLGNLDDLKRFILPVPIRGQDDYDALFASLGPGVARQLERFCGRRFARVGGDVCRYDAALPRYWLPRIPVEEVINVEILTADGGVAAASAAYRCDADSGEIRVSAAGADTVSVTYTAGWSFETLEPGADGHPSLMPAGAIPLPADLKLAWQLQCQRVFECKDHLLPKALKGDREIMAGTGDIKLLQGVKELLQPYKRYQLL